MECMKTLRIQTAFMSGSKPQVMLALWVRDKMNLFQSKEHLYTAVWSSTLGGSTGFAETVLRIHLVAYEALAQDQRGLERVCTRRS